MPPLLLHLIPTENFRKKYLLPWGNRRKIELKLSRTPSYSILIFLLFRILEGSKYEVGLTTDKDIQNKLVLMHQASIHEFEGEFKFGMEDKKWQ